MTQNDSNWIDPWLQAQKTMWSAWLPSSPAQQGDQAAAAPASLQAQFDELRDTWQASIGRWSELAKESAAGAAPTPEQLRELFSPASWAAAGKGGLDAALQRVLEGPRYAVLWDLDRQWLELQKLTLQRDKAVVAYQAVMQKAWNLAFERFTKALASKPAADKATWRGMVDQWLAVANDTLIEVYRSEEFTDAQRQMLRSASDRHLQERRIAEAWCAASHIPTRSEVDELQRQAVVLRRELRALRRATTAPVTSAAPPPAAPSPRRARPTARRKAS